MPRRVIGRFALLASVPTAAGTVVVRPPRWSDAGAWSAARLANRAWLERAFPAWGDDWVAEQSPAAWLQRCRALRDGAVRPAVVLLDGRLVGEVGIDAVDARTNTGEASAWLIRDHGGPTVMQVATLLTIRNGFGTPGGYDRILSPVATTSRRGRAPGLSAAGFEIEGTLRRPDGSGELADHDMWTIHNTPAVRVTVERTLARCATGTIVDGVPNGPRPDLSQLRELAPAGAREILRSGRKLIAGRTSNPVRPAAGPVRYDDVGTATVTLVPATGGTVEARVQELRAHLADLTRTASWARQVEVRFGPAADALVPYLDELGLTHAATFRATPDGPLRFAGEQVWSRPLT